MSDPYTYAHQRLTAVMARVDPAEPGPDHPNLASEYELLAREVARRLGGDLLSSSAAETLGAVLLEKLAAPLDRERLATIVEAAQQRQP